MDYAYDQLLSEGYIEAKPYKGYFVCRLEGIFTMEQQEMTEPEVVRPDSQEERDTGAGRLFPLWNRYDRFPLRSVETDHEKYPE